MAVKNNFYSEIFEQEQKWIELINAGLINSIYCKYQLQPFYIEKLRDLENEYKLTKNALIGQIKAIVNNIISQIELINEQYVNNKLVDTKSLIPLFLTTQMSTATKKEESLPVSSVDVNLQVRKQLLENEIRSYSRENNTPNDDYVYDDFPEEKGKVK